MGRETGKQAGGQAERQEHAADEATTSRCAARQASVGLSPGRHRCAGSVGKTRCPPATRCRQAGRQQQTCRRCVGRLEFPSKQTPSASQLRPAIYSSPPVLPVHLCPAPPHSPQELLVALGLLLQPVLGAVALQACSVDGQLGQRGAENTAACCLRLQPATQQGGAPS